MAGAQGGMSGFVLEVDSRGGEALKQMQGSGEAGRWSFPAFSLQEFLALEMDATHSLDSNVRFPIF